MSRHTRHPQASGTDGDGDGLDDNSEFIDGSDPLDPASVPVQSIPLLPSWELALLAASLVAA